MRGFGSPVSTLLLLLLLLKCCAAYIRMADSAQELATTTTANQEEESRRFGWMINWLNERGPVGQVFANVVIALFVLPPLGPIVCTFLENCDSTRSTARGLIYHITDSEYSRGRSLPAGALSEDVTDILRWLDEAYNEYS